MRPHAVAGILPSNKTSRGEELRPASMGTGDERSQWCNRLLRRVAGFVVYRERRPAMTSRRISRKEFLGIGAGAAAGVALAGSGMGTFSTRQAAAATLAAYGVP